MNYKTKYLKYKNKYLNLKQSGGINHIDAEIQLYCFTIEYDDTKIEIVPLKCYKITDDFSYIIIYKIEIKSNTYNEYTMIPYYMSDGQTNKLRATLLLPFLSWKLQNKDRFTYPNSMHTDKYPSSKLKFKHELFTNLNFDKYQNDFLITKMTKIEVATELKENSNLIIDSSPPSYSTNLLSVLPRIGNIMDFIIGTYNNSIIEEFGRDLEIYKDNIQQDDYTFCDKYAPCIDSTFDSYDLTKTDVINDNYNEYRYILLKYIYDLINDFKKYEFFNVVSKKITIENTTIDKYNKEIYPLCDEKNVVNDMIELLLNDYLSISDKLHNIIIHKLNDLSKSMKEYKISECQSIIKRWLDNIVIDKNNILPTEYDFLIKKGISYYTILICLNKINIVDINDFIIKIIDIFIPEPIQIYDITKDDWFKNMMKTGWRAKCI